MKTILAVFHIVYCVSMITLAHYFPHETIAALLCFILGNLIKMRS